MRVREGAVAKEGQSTELVALLRTTSFSRFLALGFGLIDALELAEKQFFGVGRLLRPLSITRELKNIRGRLVPI